MKRKLIQVYFAGNQDKAFYDWCLSQAELNSQTLSGWGKTIFKKLYNQRIAETNQPQIKKQ